MDPRGGCHCHGLSSHKAYDDAIRHYGLAAQGGEICALKDPMGELCTVAALAATVQCGLLSLVPSALEAVKTMRGVFTGPETRKKPN